MARTLEQAQAALDEMDAGISLILTGGQSYTYGTTKFERANLEDLRRLRADVAAEVQLLTPTRRRGPRFGRIRGV